MEKEEKVQEVKKSWFKFKPSNSDGKVLAFWQFLASTIIILGSMLAIGGFFIEDFGGDNSSDSAVDESIADENCNVTGIELHGDILTYISPSDYDADGNKTVDQTASQDVLYMINEAEKDEKTKAILLEVDSYGGSPVAGEEIANALKNAKKPTVALIRGAGDSAAYWAATGASRIFASRNSDVGSIGVTMSYLDASKQNKDQGLTYNQLSSGKFKDTGDPDKGLSEEEKALFMRDINIIKQNFIRAVAENRKLELKKVEALADGSTMLGEMALQNGLIDQLGGTEEARQYLKDKIGEEVEVCW